MNWQPIETAPKNDKVMFIAIAVGVKVTPESVPYTTDPWCVWQDVNRGEFVRWPHRFRPTHWMPLPEPPK